MNSQFIEASELIITDSGKIYHLNLAPSDLAQTVITVGDPDRVAMVSKYFDSVEIRANHREFVTHTGFYKGHRISVVSTGIGPDNIDIVLNELDALVNIDFASRQIKNKKTALEIIRIGTAGGLIPGVPVDSFVISQKAIGLDNMIHYYAHSESFSSNEYIDAFTNHMNWNPLNSRPYIVEADPDLFHRLASEKTIQGTTVTNVGFYGPQGRKLQLELHDESWNSRLENFEFNGEKITNLEMETAAIYGLSKLLGHKAVSMNAIVANRALGKFSQDSQTTIDSLIRYTLDKITS